MGFYESSIPHIVLRLTPRQSRRLLGSRPALSPATSDGTVGGRITCVSKKREGGPDVDTKGGTGNRVEFDSPVIT